MKHLWRTYYLLLFGCLSTIAFAQTQSNDPSIISSKSKVELIKDGFTNLEGSSVSLDGIIFFVELIHSGLDLMGSGRIWSYDPASNKFELFTSPSNLTAGTEFDLNGKLICAEFSDGGGRRITERNIRTREARFLAIGYQGKPFNGPNDLAIDKQNRIYFTDYPFTIRTETMHHRFGGVYRVDPNGTVIRIIANAGLPNGIVISPDQKTLYVGTNGYDIWSRQAILAYDLTDEGGATFRSIFIDYGITDFKPDGLTVDIEGNLYVSMFSRVSGTGVRIYSPNGEELAFIETPTAIQNVTFGRGDFNKTLFMVGQTSMYKVKLEVEGYHLIAN